MATLRGMKPIAQLQLLRTCHAVKIFSVINILSDPPGRGAIIDIPVLIRKREQEKGPHRSKMVAFSNYFFDTTQGHSQINGCTVRNV
ncbi:hypothetical protein ACNKHO_23515 [Shigella flexneri]